MRVNDTIDKCKHNVLLLVVVSLVVGIARGGVPMRSCRWLVDAGGCCCY